MTRAQARRTLLPPLAVWAFILCGVAATCIYAHVHSAPVKPAFTFLVATSEAVLSGLVFMRLDKAPPIVRLAAVSGPLWLSMLFVLAFGDYLTRRFPL
jgi:cytochrome c oxidase subunit IV